ncbi:MAG: iron-containing redox enzyme family protein [Sphingomonadaceae bacterium]|nr:iron-containing redox enzyme family protein [Sphingomonadaceae bacterium]
MAKPVSIGDSENYFSDGFQRDMARWNHRRLMPCSPDEAVDNREWLLREAAMMVALREGIGGGTPAVPTDVTGFLARFANLIETGPGQNDPLFDWIADHASFAEMRWFFEQEAAGEAGFDDLVAMTQVKMPVCAKLELARNYWDEMGRGNMKGMHGPMLGLLADAIDATPTIDTTVWESLMLANAMTAMATRREYAWHSIGALGVIELTAPGRAALVAKGLRRLGVRGKHRHYFDLHAVLDIKHSEEWNREVIASLIADDPSRARFIAEGALIRLACGARCYRRYRAELWEGRAEQREPIARAA